MENKEDKKEIEKVIVYDSLIHQTTQKKIIFPIRPILRDVKFKYE